MIRVVVDDLAVRSTDAIVRPVTARLDAASSAGRRVEEAGGTEFTSRLRLQKDLAVGAAVVTGGGGGLPAEFVIHAVIQNDTEPVAPKNVARAWLSALQRAREWEFARLTVPPLGTGTGNLSVDDAAGLMVTVVMQFGGLSFPQDVCVVVDSPEDLVAFEAAVRRAEAAQS
ncbi:MAG TPA: macro domain-containing protein [Gemmatimonadales bacterium]|nr:macro domain-containing protein [Gemmatimonadales bacterium]